MDCPLCKRERLFLLGKSLTAHIIRTHQRTRGNAKKITAKGNHEFFFRKLNYKYKLYGYILGEVTAEAAFGNSRSHGTSRTSQHSNNKKSTHNSGETSRKTQRIYKPKHSLSANDLSRTDNFGGHNQSKRSRRSVTVVDESIGNESESILQYSESVANDELSGMNISILY